MDRKKMLEELKSYLLIYAYYDYKNYNSFFCEAEEIIKSVENQNNQSQENDSENQEKCYDECRKRIIEKAEKVIKQKYRKGNIRKIDKILGEKYKTNKYNAITYLFKEVLSSNIPDSIKLELYSHFIQNIENDSKDEINLIALNSYSCVRELLDRSIKEGNELIRTDENVKYFVELYLKNKDEVSRIEHFDYSKVSTEDVLTLEQLKQLYKLIDIGDKGAKEFVIIKNMTLVKKIVAEFVKKNSNEIGIEFEEYAQEGYLELLNVVNKYNPFFNITFSTYAYKNIFAHLYIFTKERIYPVKIQPKKLVEINKIGRKINELSLKLGREPTLYEIIENIEEATTETMIDYSILNKIPKSLNEIIPTDDSDTEFGDLQPGNTDDEDLEIYREQFYETLRSCLTQKEYDAVAIKFKLPMPEEDVKETKETKAERIARLALRNSSKFVNKVFVTAKRKLTDSPEVYELNYYEPPKQDGINQNDENVKRKILEENSKKCNKSNY